MKSACLLPVMLVCLLLVPLAISGCGSGGSSAMYEQLTTSDPQSSSGRYWHIYETLATSDGTATVKMSSTVMDTALVVTRVYSDGTETTITVNDDSNGSTDSEAVFSVIRDATYHIYTTSYRGGETGSFTLDCSKELGSVQRIDSGRSSRALPDSSVPAKPGRR